MPLGYKPKVGEIVHCEFGRFFDTDGDRIEDNDLSAVDYRNFDGRIPPEIIKRRLVLILNPKLSGGALIVPISASEDSDSYTKEKYHVSFPYEPLRFTTYEDKPRWAKANLVQMVSNQRLARLVRASNKTHIQTVAKPELVESVQRAVIDAINAKRLLPPEESD